jgi:hypothetical protein
MRAKHRNDKNHGKNGWVGGNPRYGKSKGFRKGQRAATKQQERKAMNADDDNDLGKLVTNNLVTISYDLIREAMKGENYTARLAGDDGQYVMDAVNVGIDARLEACYVPDRGDHYRWCGGKLVTLVSPESFPVLLRRLFEADNDENEGGPGTLAADMLMTLGFNESGKLVGREALGLD